MTWTLFWQIFILMNLAGFWVGVIASGRSKVVNNFLGNASDR